MGWYSQAYTMGAIPCWLTSFPPTKKKKGIARSKSNTSDRSSNRRSRFIRILESQMKRIMR